MNPQFHPENDRLFQPLPGIQVELFRFILDHVHFVLVMFRHLFLLQVNPELWLEIA